MELHDYLLILRRRWRIVAACVLVAIAVAGLYTVQATPQYASKSRVFVATTPTNSTDAYQGGLFSQQRVSSYADAVTGLELNKRVADRLHIGLSAEQLASRVSASVVPNTVLLNLTVTDTNPARAQRINRALLAELDAFVAQVETPPGKTTPVLKLTVLDPAQLPTSPVSPQPMLNLGLAAILGLLVGIGLAIARDLLDTTVKSGEAVSQILGTPMMAGIGYDSDVNAHPLVTSLGTHDPRVEGFRVLRTNLQFVDVDSDSKAIVVTSAMPGEGKSTTAVNIGLTMAQAGHRVLLMDCDLRRPQMAKVLGLPGEVGVTTVLVGRIDVVDALQLHAPSGLAVLASGAIPPNPAELLQSRAMDGLLAELRSQFDVIIIDAPPLLPVTDAALLSAETDGALLVVRHGKTTRDQLQHARDRLVSVGARPLGFVLNMLPHKGLGSGYGYGYGPTDDVRMDSRESEHPPVAHGSRSGATSARSE